MNASQVVQAVSAWAASDPDRIALRGDGKTFRYGALLEAAEETAYLLRSLSVRCAALTMENGPLWCVADLAAAMAGVAVVPLPPFFTPAQGEHALRSAGADVLLELADDGEWKITPLAFPPVKLPEETAKITYTSGTTGVPKGVCLSQTGMEAVAGSLVDIIGARAASRHLALLPLAVLLENVAGLYATLLAGGTYIVEPLAALGFQGMLPDGEALLDMLEEEHITSCILVPEYLRVLVEALKKRPRPLPEMQFMAVGGAKVSPALLVKASTLGLPVYQGYGLSESASVVAVNTPTDNRPGSVGKILPHIQSEITKSGELILRDPALLGYVGEETHRGEYATGDLVRRDEDGFLFIEGRRRNVLITAHGRNVSPEWPQSELLAEPEIAQALIVGEAQPHLGALIVSAAAEASIDAAVTRANARLPEYARIKTWRRVPPFTALNGLATASGRLRREEMMRHYRSVIDGMYHDKEQNMGFFERLQRETQEGRQALYDVPAIVDAAQGRIDKAAYLAFLEQAYHHVRHTTPLLMLTGARLPHSKEWLRDAVAEYIEEEVGHQEWILSDITHCGGDAEAVRNGQPNEATEMMVAYAYDSVSRINPASFFGMVFVLEGTSTAMATQAAEAIAASLDLPKTCFSYLTSHGALDLSHMEFFKGLMNRIDDPTDQEAIIHMAKRMFVLYANVFRSLPHAREARHAA